MSPQVALLAVNFCLADVAGGLGPFLATWLAEVAHWNPAQIGYVITASTIGVMVFSTPAGAIVDRLCRPRLMLGVACAAVVIGTVGLLPLRAFWPILATQSLVAIGGALGAPAVTALTLAVVGKKGFPRQQGNNEASNHAGNVVAAALVAGLTYVVGTAASIAVLAVMAAATAVVLLLIPSDAIDSDRGCGRNQAKEGEDSPSGSLRVLVRDRRLLVLAASIGLFHLGNAAMLPLLGQKLAQIDNADATKWMAACVIVAQLTMVPIAFAAGRMADKRGARWLLLASCAVLPVRGLIAAFAPGVWWLIPIQILDGIGAGMLSVAMPIAVADLTYGGGRTQTAIGAISTLQGIGGAMRSRVSRCRPRSRS
jgi:MFS family permease